MYYNGGGADDPAITRDILENELMEEYHWLPKDVAEIPYKKMQKILLIKKQKNAIMENKLNVEKLKRDQASGPPRYREV